MPDHDYPFPTPSMPSASAAAEHHGPQPAAAPSGAGAAALSAFPSGDGVHGGGPCHDRGMSLRDYFAAQAMIGLAYRWAAIEGDMDARVTAHAAYVLADAMLGARDR